MRRAIIASSLVLLPFMGTACPSDDEVEPPDAPILELGFSPVKMFDFTWEEVEGAEHYELLESAMPGDPFVPIAEEILDDGISISMPLHLRQQARYVLRACNDAGCTESDPVSVVGTLAEAVGYFKASNTDVQDYYGLAMALSGDGNTLAVGAFQEASNATGIGGNQTNNAMFGAGAVYVYARSAAGDWSQQAYVKASNTDSFDNFGYSVALSDDGDTLAVGARDEASSATGINGSQSDDSLAHAGAVYVFGRNTADVWSQRAYVKASNPGPFDHFGETVALSGDGNTLVVGARFESSNATGIDGNQADDSASGSGAVYVFARNASDDWSQQAYVKASNTRAGSGFGSSVALSSDGSTLAVGAQDERSSAVGIGGTQSDTSLIGAGAVYVFARNPSNDWSQQAYVKASNTDMFDYFGTSVALSGDGSTLAVGARGESGNGSSQADDSVSQAGAVYVFSRDTMDSWSQQAYVKPSVPGVYDGFGRSVELSRDGSTLAVGAPREASSSVGVGGNQADDSAPDAGAAYVFVRDPVDQWSQRAYVKAPNTDADDSFGWVVGLSGDGNTLAVAATSEDSGATGVGGNQADDLTFDAGAVYLY